MAKEYSLSISNFADIMGVSRSTANAWVQKGVFKSSISETGDTILNTSDLSDVDEIREMVESDWENEMATVPNRDYTSIELFAGAGGLALGMDKAGLKHVMLNEFDHDACQTLLKNRPDWHVAEGDVRNLDFTRFAGNVDIITGGFPCQAFSFAGKKAGFNDTRGTLFFELARAVKVVNPKVFVCENVKGLVSHDGGHTLSVIRDAIADLGYTLVEPRVLQAIKYQVPQKRERLILVAIRNDYAEKVTFHWPSPYHRIMTLRDAFYKGELYDCDTPNAEGGASYSEKKAAVLKLVPPGGDWRDLPTEVAKEFMGVSYESGGGKTGMARRLSLDEPSLTLTCSPVQKQTERCHPIDTRPLSVREYARIQTFPDNWMFSGSMAAKYKQIGNAVPVNLAYAIGRAVVRLLNDIDDIDKRSAVSK